MKHWTRKERRTIVEDRWLKLFADTCELPNGHTVEPFYVIEEKEWVHIVAINSEGSVLLTKQYRYAADIVCTELPCGAVEDREEPLAAAKRELKEETGFEANQWALLAVTYANPARQTNRVHCYLARDLRDTKIQNLDISEDIDFLFSSIPEVRKMIGSGEFAQALHVASLLLAAEVLRESNQSVQTSPTGRPV